MPKSPPTRILYWFRTDLRVHDSPALHAALTLYPAPECFYPVWCWDPHYVFHARVGPNRWQYLLECQADLSAALTRLNPAQKLLVVREAPQTVLPKLFKAWRITHLVFEKDTDAYAAERDRTVVESAREAGVEVVVRVGRTLWDPEDIVRENGGKPTMSFAALKKAAKALGDPPAPIPEPGALPDPGDTALSSENVKPHTEIDLNEPHRSSHPDQSYSSIAGPNGDFSIPTLAELGISTHTATTPHHGGESLALASLSALIKDTKYIATFEKPKTAPTAFAPASTTLLSPHLHFGSLGVRRFFHDVQVAVRAYKGKDKAKEPVNLPGQLLFREMYFAAQCAVGPAFVHVVGNPIARYIPWHLPTAISRSPSTPTYTVDSPAAHAWFLRWAWGLTGFPFIDALMRQLHTEGWIHHLGRHMVACFLTRGGAYVSWEHGAEVFEALLLDHEPACNVGNWLWLSCSAFFSGYFKTYSPVAFGKKWDSKGEFVRRYVPEVREYPDRWVYEPHRAPLEVQSRAGCLVREMVEEAVLPDLNKPMVPVPPPPEGLVPLQDARGEMWYPTPMFDFGERREVCMRSMKEAYAVGVYGDDPRVLDGSVGRLFRDGEEDEKVEKDEKKRKRRAGASGPSSVLGGSLDGWAKRTRSESARG